MQDKYVGDVGDFAKFRLLRHLFAQGGAFETKTLAQIWYWHCGENERNNDGAITDYFDRIAGCDTILQERLYRLVRNDERRVEALEKMRLLERARYFYEKVPKAFEDRVRWMRRAVAFAEGAHAVAVAPDNGMALRCDRTRRNMSLLSYDDFGRKANAHKYIFAEEIRCFYTLPGVEWVMLYQHLGRCMSHEEQAFAIEEMLKRRYPHVSIVKHRPYSPRLFCFLAKNEVIAEQLRYRLRLLARDEPMQWKLYDEV